MITYAQAIERLSPALRERLNSALEEFAQNVKCARLEVKVLDCLDEIYRTHDLDVYQEITKVY
jgi:hypothetical protein